MNSSPQIDDFDFLIGFEKPLMRVDEAARVLGRSVNYVYGCIKSGELEAHRPKNRETCRYKITRRSVLLYLSETATYRSADWMTRMKVLLREMTLSQLDDLIADATSLRRQKGTT